MRSRPDTAPGRRLNVLICEDDPIDAEICLDELRRAGYEPTHRLVQTAEEFQRSLREESWAVVLSDYTMPRFGALEALRLLRQATDDIPFIVVTGSIDEETAVTCLKEGADDYILKENTARLAPAVRAALDVFEERRRRRQLEEELRQSQKLEAVGRLAAGVAHDFNNLLTVIRGYTDQILEHAQESGVQDAARQVQGASERAARLTARLLGFGRKHPVQPSVVDPSALLHELVELMRPSLGAKTQVRVQAEARDALWVDRGLLEQVLVNLVLNALDAMPDGGCLTISTADVGVDVQAAPLLEVPPGAYVRLTVQDTGHGIAPEHVDKVFEPFFSTKSPAHGTGLGLSTAYGIVKQCHGAIRVESDVERGTRFDVWLPATRPHAATAPEPASEPMPRPKRATSVLVVEDEDSVRRLMTFALSRDGYDVHEARSGLDALEQCHAGLDHIDLVLCDMRMPGLGGAELFHRLRERRPDLRFLFVSGYADCAFGEVGEQPGVSALAKPFGAADLLRAVRAALAPA